MLSVPFVPAGSGRAGGPCPPRAQLEQDQQSSAPGRLQLSPTPVGRGWCPLWEELESPGRRAATARAQQTSSSSQPLPCAKPRSGLSGDPQHPGVLLAPLLLLTLSSRCFPAPAAPLLQGHPHSDGEGHGAQGALPALSSAHGSKGEMGMMCCRRPSVLPSFLAQLGLRSHLALLQPAQHWLGPAQPSSLICLAWDKQRVPVTPGAAEWPCQLPSPRSRWDSQAPVPSAPRWPRHARLAWAGRSHDNGCSEHDDATSVPTTC